jgi:hypothetical protein
MTYDGEHVRLYINGEMVTEENWPGKIDINGANLYIGAESDGGAIDATHGKFKGLIDDALIANRAFDIGEIQNFMAGTSPVNPEEKLSTCWGKVKNSN